uniref:Uncharacterized protein n=1 Tax=Avena sativa TaxID=4498 RepID=A0ACD5WS84_AVESA
MELLVLLALILLGLSVLIRRRRSYTSRRGSGTPPAPVILHKISDPAVAHRLVVQDADAFSNRPVMPFFSDQANARGGRLSENVSSAPYGPHWRALRCNITAETLHPSRLGHLPQLQREAIQDLVAGLSADDGAGTGKEPRAVAVRDHLELAVFRVVSRLCFGDGVDECHVRAMCAVIKGFHLTIGALNPLSGSSSTLASKLAQWRQKRRLFALHARMTELCLPLIAAARQRRGPDNDGGCRPYVDSFLHLRVPAGDGDKDGGRRALTDDEMVNLVVEFLGAGEGTVAACLEWTLAHLVSQPEAQEKLRREVDGEAAADSPSRSQLIRGMPYMNAVILESLRMHPPAPFAQRRVQAGVLPGGAEAAPEGSDVFVMFVLGDIGRDSKTWKDPDAFCPERFLAGGEAEGVGPLPGPKETRMMPFGAGHRFCPGVGLSMVIIKCFLAALVREFEWAPPADAVVDLTELDGFLKTMKKPLAVRLTRRT